MRARNSYFKNCGCFRKKIRNSAYRKQLARTRKNNTLRIGRKIEIKVGERRERIREIGRFIGGRTILLIRRSGHLLSGNIRVDHVEGPLHVALKDGNVSLGRRTDFEAVEQSLVEKTPNNPVQANFSISLEQKKKF